MTDRDLGQAANLSREQHHPILTFMTAKRYRPQFLISCIFMLFQQFDGAPDRARFCARSSSFLCVITFLCGGVGLSNIVLPRTRCMELGIVDERVTACLLVVQGICLQQC